MNKIEELIEQLCPEGVEFRELSKCALINRGRRVTKSELKPENKYPVYSGGVTPMGYFEKSNQSANTITVVKYGTAGFVNFITEDFWANDVCYCLKPDVSLNNKFLFYYLKNKQLDINSLATNAIPAHLPSESIGKFLIPLPPLPIQEEIVDTLNKLTELQEELQEELQARARQYEYYRNGLLNFEGKDLEWKTLGDVAKILRGTALTEKDSTSNEFPVIANAPNPVYSHGKYNRTGETVVIARSGAYAGLVSYWNMTFFLTDAFSIHPNNKLFNTKFVYYLLKRDQDKIHQMKKGSGVPHVRANDFNSYSIPMPPLHEQERIVGILDKFEALVNDISIGLPAEIKARRKQYEYYRGKLLDFKSISNG